MSRSANIKDYTQIILSIIAAIVSGISLLLAWQANETSRATYDKQFNTDYSVNCSEKQQGNEFTMYGSLYVSIPIACSISNLSNRTITVDRIYGNYTQHTDEGGKRVLGIYIANAKTEDKALSTDLGNVNISISQGQKLDIVFEAQYWVVDNFNNFISCEAPNESRVSKCKLKINNDFSTSKEQWEKAIDTYSINTINNMEDTYTVFEFTTTDDVVKKSNNVCLYLQSCFF